MASSRGSVAPNTTLYIKNIPNKIKKAEVKRQLYCLFIPYGKILDIVATKIGNMKGQAFIVFTDLASSTNALRAMDGFIFYEKPLSVDYAQTKSKATIVAERGPEALFDPDIITNSKKQKTTFSSAGAELQGRERKRAREEAGVKVVDSDDDSDEDEEEENSRIAKEENGEPEEKRPKIDNGVDAEEDEEEMEMAESDDDD